MWFFGDSTALGRDSGYFIIAVRSGMDVETDNTSIRRAALGFCALLVGIGLGRFGYPPLIPLLVKDGWFTAAQADYLGARWNLAGYVAGSAGAGIAGHHVKTSLAVRLALVTVAAGFFACALPLPFLWFVFWRLAAGVSGAVLMVIGVPSVLAKIPPAVRGRSGGLIFTGVGAGMALSGTVIPVFARMGTAGRVAFARVCIGCAGSRRLARMGSITPGDEHATRLNREENES